MRGTHPLPPGCGLAEAVLSCPLLHMQLPAWSRRAALLRLLTIAPLGKWRALAECTGDLDKQKLAYAAAHGDFWYLLAICSARAGEGQGSALLAHICR